MVSNIATLASINICSCWVYSLSRVWVAGASQETRLHNFAQFNNIAKNNLCHETN